MQNSLGTVETGKLAALVLLDANPLEDIRNTQKISGVFMQGHSFDRQALDGLLQKVEPSRQPPDRPIRDCGRMTGNTELIVRLHRFSLRVVDSHSQARGAVFRAAA